jgi:hypothetical protein
METTCFLRCQSDVELVMSQGYFRSFFDNSRLWSYVFASAQSSSIPKFEIFALYYNA